MKINSKDIIVFLLVFVLTTPFMYLLALLITGNARIEFGHPSLEQKKKRELQTETPSIYRDSLLARHSKTFLALQKERSELDFEREQLIEEKKKILMVHEDLEAERKKLAAERQRIEKLVQESDELEQKRIKQLARVYGAMRPAEAASILETLDDNLIISIIRAIGDDRQKANIISALSREKATRISRIMGKPVAQR